MASRRWRPSLKAIGWITLIGLLVLLALSGYKNNQLVDASVQTQIELQKNVEELRSQAVEPEKQAADFTLEDLENSGSGDSVTNTRRVNALRADAQLIVVIEDCLRFVEAYNKAATRLKAVHPNALSDASLPQSLELCIAPRR